MAPSRKGIESGIDSAAGTRTDHRGTKKAGGELEFAAVTQAGDEDGLDPSTDGRNGENSDPGWILRM